MLAGAASQVLLLEDAGVAVGRQGSGEGAAGGADRDECSEAGLQVMRLPGPKTGRGGK